MKPKLLKAGPLGERCAVCREPIDPSVPCWLVTTTSGERAYIESTCTGDHGCAILSRQYGKFAEQKPVREMCSVLGYLGGRDFEELRKVV